MGIALGMLIVLVMWRVWWLEEHSKDHAITEMAKKDLENARRRGDIDKHGRCYHGERKIL